MNDFFRFYCNLDRGNDIKLAKKLFLIQKKNIILDSRQFIQKISVTPSADSILLLTETLAKIEGHRERLGSQEKKLKEAAKREKYEKYERMKQGPAKNMTVAVLKEFLKDKGMAFSSKAKKSELVDLFNAAHHTSGRPIVAA